LHPGLCEEEVVELKEVFDLFDSDSTGQIPGSDFKAAMNTLSEEDRKQGIFQMILNMNINEHDMIKFDEFLNLMTGNMAVRKSDKDLQEIFMLINEDYFQNNNSNEKDDSIYKHKDKDEYLRKEKKAVKD